LYGTAALRHALPLHGTSAPRKLAGLLLFLKIRLQVPIPASFMLYAIPGRHGRLN
jgi:hypothetical protein